MTMRPKYRRMIDGIPLAHNLYKDNFGRVGYYRYRRPDGSFKGFRAESVELANELAEQNNLRRDDYEVLHGPAQKQSLPHFTDKYISWREANDPTLLKKASWDNRCYALRGFAEHFSLTHINKLRWEPIRDWWQTLGHHQQKQRHAELRRMFNWLMGQGLCAGLKYNPFTTSDDRPRLYLKALPAKARGRLTLDDFWRIYKDAGDRGFTGLRTAMAISLVTTAREGDILKMRFTDVVDGCLMLTVGKSEQQRGSARASRLKWRVDNYPLLRDTIASARETSLAHRRCPFIVHHKPRRIQTGTSKNHPCQLLKAELARQFRECRGCSTATFHEVRALAGKLYRDAGYSVDDIKNLMAHTNESTTLGYLDGQQLPFQEVTMSFCNEFL